MGGFIHQQDCILLGGVLREEGLNSVLEEGEKRAILDFLLSPHSFLSLICSIYLLCTRHCVKNQGGNDEEDKIQISFSALVKISHRFSICFRLKISFLCLPFRALHVLAHDSIPSPTTHHFRQQKLDSLSINIYVREEPASEVFFVCSLCLLSNLMCPLRAELEMLPIFLEKLFRIYSYPAPNNSLEGWGQNPI